VILGWIQRLQTLVERATPGPLLVRVGIFVTTLAALLTAYPAVVVASRLVLLLVLVAAVPALAPRRGAPTLLALVAVAGWLVSTMGYEEPVTLFRLLGLAGLLYLMHTLAALAAALPYDAVVAPEVLVRWVGRALLVVAASAVLALLVVVTADAFRGAYLLASLLGLAIAITVTAVLTHLLRRPPSSS
jgi:hypothetical protein